jgi:hypothetical protein
MRSITIDQKSIEAAAAGQLDLKPIVTDLSAPPSSNRAACVQVGENGYILSPRFHAGDGLLTISLDTDGPLALLPQDVREGTLSRLLRCALMVFTGRGRSIPVTWRPYHLGNRISFQADRKVRSGGRTDAGRVVMDVMQGEGPGVFAFALDRSGTRDVGEFKPDLDLLKSASANVAMAVSQNEKANVSNRAPDQLGDRITLEASIPDADAPHVPFDDWYSVRLTIKQRLFVDHPLSSSVRLIGPAGSGKTVALVVKCLRELREAARQNATVRLLYLTSASSTAESVKSLILDMDLVTGNNALESDPPSLVVTTIYALADSYMRYDLNNLSPVSLDGHEGRAFQADILNLVIEEELKADWIASRSRCSKPLVTYMEAANTSGVRRFFLWELLNEFACVLDAEGVRSGLERRERYLSDKRKSWMMDLKLREDREVVLRLYDRFGEWLRKEKAIGSDQMIADFLNYLDSYRWEATRTKDGFDAIFVDELHLFNRQERMVLCHLLRKPDATPPVFVAYDAKQSPRDTFLSMPSAESQKYNLWTDAGLGKTERIELVDVFRYTPQIVRALSSIDKSFPGQDLDSDWPAYRGISRTEDGPVPTVCELASTVATFGVVFKRATAIQGRLAKDRRVAVLCCSYDLFGRYLEYPDLRTDFYAITSRDEALEIRPRGKRFVFSMPEYVAGLQYDTVLLIDVNRGEVPDGPYSLAALRKFASQVYLGASRAERRLEFYSCAEHGGIAPLLSLAVAEGAITSIERRDLD